MTNRFRATPILCGLAILTGVIATTGAVAEAPADSSYGLVIDAEGAAVGRNAWQNIETAFSPSGLEISGLAGDASWRWTQDLRGFGTRDALQTLTAAEPNVLGSRVDYQRSGPLSQWYVNTPDGLQQWFGMEEAPEGVRQGEPLVLAFASGGDLSLDVEGSGHVMHGFDSAGRAVVRTNLWQVKTASGRVPYAEMALTYGDDGVATGFEVVAELGETDFPVSIALATGSPKTVGLRFSNPVLGPSLGDPPVLPLAVPVEDTCSGAQVIPTDGPFPYLATTVNLFDATLTGDPSPTCAFNNVFSRGIWYKFSPPVTALYNFSTCVTTSPETTRSDTVLALFTLVGGVCGGAATQVGCDDDACVSLDFQSSLSSVLSPGTTYYILVYSWNTTAPPSPAAANVQLRVTQVPPPENDSCAAPTVLPLNRAVNGSNLQAANDYSLSGTTCFTGIGNSSCTAAGRDTVYSFTAPAAGNYSFKVQTTDASGGGNLLLYSAPTCPGSPGAITCAAPVLANNRNALTAVDVAAEEIVCQPLSADQTVYLFVDECAAGVTTSGAYRIEASTCVLETEANGTPATANSLNACPLEGASNALQDVDFFSLGTPAAGSRVFAVLDAVQTNNPNFDLRVTTATDTLEFDNDNNASPWGESSPNVGGTSLTGTASYLRVNHAQNNVTSEPYRLYSVLQPPGGDVYGSSSSPELRDSTNTFFGSFEAAGNNYFNATISSTTDFDVFRFCAAEGDLITLSFDMDPGRNNTPIDLFGLLYDGETGAFITGGQDTAATSTNTTSGAGSLSSNTPFSNAEAVVWRAQYTGAYLALADWAVATNIPAASDYLVSIGVNCQDGAAQSALVNTDLTGPASAPVGEALTYTVSLTNGGPNMALDPQFTYVLPPGAVFVGITGNGTDFAECDMLPPSGGTGTVRCKVECLRVGGFFDFEITVLTDYCSGAATLSNTVNTTSLTATAVGSVLTDSLVTNLTDDGTCEDGDGCTTGDTCSGSTCVAGPPIDCDDADPCTIDTCESATGCSSNFDEGAICDDGDPCTQIDICLTDPGGCVGFEPLGSPGEVGGVAFDADKVTFSWGSDAAAFTYDAVRGDVSALPVGPGGGDEICFPDISGTSTSDATVPASGVAFWYLVRGENTCAAPGPYGNQSNGTPRSTTTCP